MAAHDNIEEAEGYIEELVRQTGWRPARVGLFGGALLYTHYGFVKRHLMKKIVREKGNPDTDTSRDYVYTEWDGVKNFVEGFLETLVPEDTRDARG
jgi:menaquinone-dependent protoporphyrinogen oxidase